jgi:hypothetical protein
MANVCEKKHKQSTKTAPRLLAHFCGAIRVVYIVFIRLAVEIFTFLEVIL